MITLHNYYSMQKLKAKLLYIPKLVINFFRREAIEIIDNTERRFHKQQKLFECIGLDRVEGLDKLNKTLRKLGLTSYDENHGMYSEHLIVFACLSSSKININSILEIGTFDGVTATILSELFPKATIYTLDLNDDDPMFSNSYERENKSKRTDFIKIRNERLSKHRNIRFIQCNSLGLMKTDIYQIKQDLIWIDGAHGYPAVCADITNSISLSHKDTIIMCDDVWVNVRKSDPIYKSIATWETLESFKEAGLINTTYINKRIGKKHLLERKYVAYCMLKK